MDAQQPDPVRVALESKIADLERLVETLNEVLVAHDRQLDGMAVRLDVLERKQAARPEEGAEEGSRDLADDRPPHY